MMKKTGFLHDERYQRHKTGHYHPEVPQRLACVYRGIEEAGLIKDLVPVKAEPAEMSMIEMVHDRKFISRFESIKDCSVVDPVLSAPICT